MKSISFKNFRRFADFPEFKFGDITILVGGNNAGKSTLVKALLLVLDNLRSMKTDLDNLFTQCPVFRFDKNRFHDLSIGSYTQAVNRDNPSGGIHFALSFKDEYLEEEYSLKLKITNSEGIPGGDALMGYVNKLVIANVSKGITITWIFREEDTIPYIQFDVFDGNDETIRVKLQELRAKLNEITNSSAEENDLAVIIENNTEADNLRTQINKYERSLTSSKKGLSLKIPMINEINKISPFMIEDLLNSLLNIATESTQKYKNEWPKWASPFSEVQKGVKSNASEIAEIITTLTDILSNNQVAYLQAHGVSQRTLYRIGDTSDFVAMTLTDFIGCGAYKDNDIHSFIKKWMNEFGIGADYKIDIALDEAFTISIIPESDKNKTFPMANLGMGSIQLMVLLFALAKHMKENKGVVFNTPTIIIEEPEQNLHPKVQSRLADMFFELNKVWNLKFIIETHSEYLIRRSQVLVADPTSVIGFENWDKQIDTEENPFKVYYFPEKNAPYEMIYRNDGCFSNEFGSGFFDEASNLAFKLF